MVHDAAHLGDVKATVVRGAALAEVLDAAVLVVRDARRSCFRGDTTIAATIAGTGTEPPRLFVEDLRQLLAMNASLQANTGGYWTCGLDLCSAAWADGPASGAPASAIAAPDLPACKFRIVSGASGTA